MNRSWLRRAVSFIRVYAAAVSACLYLFTIGFWSSRNREVLSTIPRLLGFGHQPPPRALPVVPLAEVLSSDALSLRHILAKDGNVSVTELAVLVSLVRKQCPCELFEIGTFDGRTTLNLATNAPEGRVHTLDLPPTHATAHSVKPGDERYIEKSESGIRFRGAECEARIVQHYGDSATFDFSAFEGQIDFVFVDGAHSYEYVRSDSLIALNLLRNRRGVIAWHDYGTDQVTEAIDELYRNNPAFRDLRHVEGTALAILVLP